MTPNSKILTSTFQRHLNKLIGALLVLVLVWQNTALAGDMAIAPPLLAASASSMSKQVSGKVDEVKGKTKQAIGKAQSDLEDKAGSVKAKVKDDLTEAKIAAESNNARMNNTADKAADKVKGFFGK
jgi:uncharacterized protein YjbJ (UPF0337 family)